MVYRGLKNQKAAIDFCKKMNAGLPLPKSKGEAAEYSNITGSGWVWMGLTDSTKSGKMAAWKDLAGNPIGNRYVNLRVIDLMTYEIQFNKSIYIIAYPTESGKKQLMAHIGNQMRMEQLHTIDQTELCGMIHQLNHTRLGVYKK